MGWGVGRAFVTERAEQIGGCFSLLALRFGRRSDRIELGDCFGEGGGFGASLLNRYECEVVLDECLRLAGTEPGEQIGEMKLVCFAELGERCAAENGDEEVGVEF